MPVRKTPSGEVDGGTCTPPIIDPLFAGPIIKRVAPAFLALQSHLEGTNGHLTLPKSLNRLIGGLNLGNYPELYYDENRIWIAFLLSVLTREELEEFGRDFETLSPNETGEVLLAGLDEPDEFLEFFERSDWGRDKRFLAVARRDFRALSAMERKLAVYRTQLRLGAYLASFYQTLSLMVWGQKLTTLVSRARDGSLVDACKAIRIDKRIQLAVPEVKHMWFEATTSGSLEERELLQKAYYTPPYKGRFSHKAAYAVFAILDQLNVLEHLSHSVVLDMFNESSVFAGGEHVCDVKTVAKLLQKYRELRKP